MPTELKVKQRVKTTTGETGTITKRFYSYSGKITDYLVKLDEDEREVKFPQRFIEPE